MTPAGAPINPTVTLTDEFGNIVYYRDHIFVPYGPYRNANDPINDPYVTYGTTADYGQHYFGPGVGATLPVSWKPTVLPSRNYINQWGTALNLNWDIGEDMLLTSITAYREYETWSTGTRMPRRSP